MRVFPAPIVLALLFACGSSTGLPHSSNSGGNADAGPVLTSNGDPPACAKPDGPSTNPPPLADLPGALDPTSRTFVVFAGDAAVPACGQPPGHDYKGDTYVLDVPCGTWTKLPPEGAPPKRVRSLIVTDADGNRGLLFGGRINTSSGPYTEMNDVWAFDFVAQTWAQMPISGTAPPGRSNAAGVVDRAGRRLVVFGGNTSTSGLAFEPANDTWALDLDSMTWTEIAKGGAKPPARLFHAMAIDPVARKAYVFAGGDANAFAGPFLSDLWVLDLTSDSWSEVATAGTGPGGRIDHALAFDTASKRLVAFGGHDDGVVGNENDLYVLDVTQSPASWTRLPHGDRPGKASGGQCTFPPDFTTIDKQSPERRNAFAFGARLDGRGFALFGGRSDCGLVADVWWWSDGSEMWTAIRQSPVGLSCQREQTTCRGLCG